MKTFGIAAVAVVAALILGFGARFSASPAYADMTGISVVPCEFLADAIDGSTVDAPQPGSPPLPAVPSANYAKVCGDGMSAATSILPADITLLANAIGNKDGVLTKSDLDKYAGWGGNQIRGGTTANGGCTTPIVPGPFSLYGAGCKLLVFAFTTTQSTVKFTTTTGLTFAPSDTTPPNSANWTCSANTPIPPQDTDCAPPVAVTDNVVVAGLMIAATGSALPGTTATITVDQNATNPQTATINVVGPAKRVSLALAPKSTIQSSGSNAAFTTCSTTSDVTDSASATNANSTIAIATVTDLNSTKLTRVPVTLKSSDTNAADFAAPLKTSGITANTGVTLDAGTNGVAQFAVICGAKGTGTPKITATINPGLATEDFSSQTLTVVGTPATVAATAAPAQIACDGTQTSTVTAKVTDAAGANVADGTNVNFSVVALGTANPINVKTVAGSASSVITPLSGSTAGVTVIITAGTAPATAQTSLRIDCSLPIPPTPGAPPPPPPAAVTGTITGPNTGSGGYLGQSGSAGFPMWTLVALALGSVALVAGGMVTRRAGK